MYKSYHFRSGIVLSLLLWLIASSVHADILVLENGDRISGKIERIWDGEITIEPDYADKFDVAMSAVVHISTDRDLDIELDDGRSGAGRFNGADADGKQQVTVNDEAATVTLEQIFEVEEPVDVFKLEGQIDLAANANRGNTETSNTQLKAEATTTFSNHRHLGEMMLSREESEGVALEEHDLYRYTYNWLFNDTWFVQGQLAYESDPLIDLESRVILSAGLGRDIWNTPRRFLSVQLGAGFQKEQFDQEFEESAVAAWSLRYRQDFLRDDLELFHNHSITHNVTGRTNTSYKTSTGVKFEMTDLFYAKLSADYDFESEPSDTSGKQDTTIVIGVGAEF